MKKRRIEISVLSNLHLGSQDCKIPQLMGYLNSISPKVLVLNGHILDDDSQEYTQMPREHRAVLSKLYHMHTNGTQIYCIYNEMTPTINHLKRHSEGILSFSRELFFDLDGKKAWFTQGDFLHSKWLQGKWVQRLGDRLFNMLTRLIAWRNSYTPIKGMFSSHTRPKANEFQNCAWSTDPKFRKVLARATGAKQCEYLICGFPGKSTRFWAENTKGKFQYLSGGDWSYGLSALEYHFKRWRTYRYSEDKLAPFFADTLLKGMSAEDMRSKNKIALGL